MSDEQIVKKRRVRYRGSHPRRFEQKYKELNPEQYADDVAKVMARGQTPAGTHRPICVNEIIEALRPMAGEVGLDATLGFGGHAEALLRKIAPSGRLFGIDVDPLELPRTEARLRALGFSEEVLTTRRMNFAGVPQLLSETSGGFDFVLADLGVSSMQIDNPQRGFTFKAPGPLDLRLNPKRGNPASVLLQQLSAESLAEILRNYSDEPHASSISRAVIAAKISTTTELADAVRFALRNLPQSTRKKDTIKSLQRTFQALRIAVNSEFEVLEQFLRLLPLCLKSGGRVAILTFHSGEDRRVKHAFQEGIDQGVYSYSSPTPVRPSSEERRSNPRSSCAKLRVAIRA
jgi:16S rRNA (cytosine1402-N4)-methyltransferase